MLSERLFGVVQMKSIGNSCMAKRIAFAEVTMSDCRSRMHGRMSRRNGHGGDGDEPRRAVGTNLAMKEMLESSENQDLLETLGERQLEDRKEMDELTKRDYGTKESAKDAVKDLWEARARCRWPDAHEGGELRAELQVQAICKPTTRPLLNKRTTSASGAWIRIVRV